MVSTKHCCWGECKSDSRYQEKLDEALKQMTAEGRKPFIPFPKPSQGLEKCQRWIAACSRENFTVKNITRNTYICALHWPGKQGPTPEHLDPLKANFTKREIEKASKSKRKPPTRYDFGPVASKKQKLDFDSDNSDDVSTQELGLGPVGNEEDKLQSVQYDRIADEKLTYQCHSTGKIVSDEGSQTEFCKYLLSAKVDTMILKNEVARMKSEIRLTPQVVSSLSYEVISQDSALMKHFIGLTTEQFMALHSFLDEICPLDSIISWNQKELDGQVTESKSGPDSKFSTQEKLYMSILRLRRGYTIKSLAVLLSTPDRTIKETQIRRIFTTYVQLMFKVFRDMQDVMFLTREN